MTRTRHPDRFRLPISIRLTIWYGFSMIVLLSLFAGVLAAAMHFNQHILLHQRLFNTQTQLLPYVGTDAGEPFMAVPLDSLSSAFYTEGPLGTFVRLVSTEGAVLYTSPNFRDYEGFVPSQPDSAMISEQTREWENHTMRVMYAPVKSRDGLLKGWLEISAHSLQIGRLIPRKSLLYAILLCVTLALLGGYLLARRALKPVGDLALAAGRIGARDLGVRLPVSGKVRDELSDLSEVFNRMLDRLEAAFERERRFTADAAHELLNPLASMRSEAEITLRQPRNEIAYRQALESVLIQSKRLGETARQLLELARLEAETPVKREPTDFSRVVLDRTTLLQETLGGRSGRLIVDVESEVVVAGSEFHLGVIVDNLLGNALKYTPSTGQIRVRLEESHGNGRFSVADTGSGFDPQEAERLFERFYRGNEPGVESREGVGLGLSVVHAIVTVLGGWVHAQSDGPGRGSTFTVQIPLATGTH